jgi:phosphohistidine phosphatase
LRHAKADRPTGTADVDRPLTERGHADAGAAGAWLAGRGIQPDLVLCSPSRRTRQTWHGVAVALSGGEAPEVHYDSGLYDGSTAVALGLLRAVGPEHRTVLLIGHNPTVSMLSSALDSDAARDSDGLRTSGIAVHDVAGAWADLTGAALTASHTARA